MINVIDSTVSTTQQDFHINYLKLFFHKQLNYVYFIISFYLSHISVILIKNQKKLNLEENYEFKQKSCFGNGFCKRFG